MVFFALQRTVQQYLRKKALNVNSKNGCLEISTWISIKYLLRFMADVLFTPKLLDCALH